MQYSDGAMPPPAAPARLRPTAQSVLWGAIGLILFILTLRETGVAPIVDGIRRVGLGFPVILVLSGVRFWLRAAAWSRCTDDPRALPHADAFRAVVAGDALGNLTPLGLLASEPAKAALVRHRLSLMAALAAIAIENLVYTLTVAAMITAGTLALLLTFDVPLPLQWASTVILGTLLVGVGLAGLVVLRGWRVLSAGVSWLDHRAPAALASRLGKFQRLEDQVYTFSARHPGRLGHVLALEAGFHVLAMAEVWVVLALLAGSWPGLLVTFVLEAVNRAITVAFKFVPLRLGVDEAGTELLTRTLGLPAGLGVTMAIVRKARVLVWAAVGVILLARHGVRQEELVP